MLEGKNNKKSIFSEISRIKIPGKTAKIYDLSKCSFAYYFNSSVRKYYTINFRCLGYENRIPTQVVNTPQKF